MKAAIPIILGITLGLMFAGCDKPYVSPQVSLPTTDLSQLGSSLSLKTYLQGIVITPVDQEFNQVDKRALFQILIQTLALDTPALVELSLAEDCDVYRALEINFPRAMNAARRPNGTIAYDKLFELSLRDSPVWGL